MTQKWTVSPPPSPPSVPVDPFDKFGWPPGAYEFQPGVYYVPYKGAHGGPFKEAKEAFVWMEAVDRRDKNLDNWTNQEASTVYVGMFPAINFIHGVSEGREAAFIYAASRLCKDGNRFYRGGGLFSGSYNDISALINYGEQEQIYEHKSFEQTVADFPDTPVSQAVRAYIAKN